MKNRPLKTELESIMKFINIVSRMRQKYTPKSISIPDFRTNDAILFAMSEINEMCLELGEYSFKSHRGLFYKKDNFISELADVILTGVGIIDVEDMFDDYKYRHNSMEESFDFNKQKFERENTIEKFNKNSVSKYIVYCLSDICINCDDGNMRIVFGYINCIRAILNALKYLDNETFNNSNSLKGLLLIVRNKLKYNKTRKDWRKDEN